MNIKSAEIFNYLRNERKYIDDLIIQIEEIETFILGVGSALKNTGGISSLQKDYDVRNIDGICKLDKVRELLAGEIDRYSRIRTEVTNVIIQLETPSAKRALLLYYFPKAIEKEQDKLFRSWEEVAEIMGCDVKTAQNYRDVGFEEFARIYFGGL